MIYIAAPLTPLLASAEAHPLDPLSAMELSTTATTVHGKLRFPAEAWVASVNLVELLKR